MAIGPSDEAIDTFTIFTSLPRENAIAWLQANDNEVDKATNAFFDGGGVLLPPRVSTVQWNEGEFHSDKTSDGQQTQGIASFSVQSPDTLNPNIFNAPSRPPSRVSNREGGIAAHHYVETEDEQMKRAMAISMAVDQTQSGQETGVTDLTTKAFGPAQREYYDNEKWAMTLPGAHTREILLNPEPFDRQRQPGTPAFLKPAPDALHLAALIKILHEIPIAREALLNSELFRPDYGYDHQWWDGESVKQLRVVNVDHGLEDAYGQELINETQRLMAFLDGTERAYGSIEGIVKLQSRHQEGDRIATFFEDWKRLTSKLAPHEHLSTIFESNGLKRDPEEEDEKCQAFSCLPINTSDMTDNSYSLYDALDEIIWEGAEGAEVFLKDMGNIVTFSVTCFNDNEPGIGIDIPASWYSDRYLESSVLQANEYRARKMALNNRIQDLAAAKEKLLKFKAPGKPAVDASSLLATAMAHFEQISKYRHSAKPSAEPNGSLETNDDIKFGNTCAQLNDLDAKITKKLKAFERAKEELKSEGNENTLFYTQPTDDLESSPSHKYTLRGVATTSQTFYVLERTTTAEEDDLISLEDNIWQWWKLEYVSSDAKPVVTTKVREEDVLKAARTESRNVLLVYADEQAVNYEPTPLPSQLVDFVRTDNFSFHSELEDFIQPNDESPGKRKALSDDQDDLVTEYPRTPPYNRDQFLDDSLDPNPPDYDLSAPSPNAMSSFRTLKPKTGVVGSSDDTIPVSLRAPDRMVDGNFTALDQDEMDQSGQEMEERSGSASLLQGRTDVNEGYRLGDYAPEIIMDDEDDKMEEKEQEEQKEGSKEREEKPSAPGTRDDTW